MAAPRSVLVVCMRRIGDVLLSTPVAHSIKAAWPDARVDMLVFAGTDGVLRGNPDVNEVIAVPEGLGAWATLRLAARLWRRYDVAICVQTGDRPTFMAWAAGRRSIGFIEGGAQSAWKRHALDDAVPVGEGAEHTVAGNLRLLGPLGIAPIATVRVRWDNGAPARAREAFPAIDSMRRFAVMHVSPKFPYKAWTSAGWVQVAQSLTQQGFPVVIAGGGSQEERDYIAGLLPQLPPGTVSVAGKVDLAALAWLLGEAHLYIGTDTAVTHMAAALGVPTLALFGPSSPVKWGPWPSTFAAGPATPWLMRGTQRRGNVFLLQGEATCVPCLGEGCEKHARSLSDCLQHLPSARVIDAVEALLSGQGRAHITVAS